MTALERAWRGARNDWRLYLLSIFSVAVAFVCLASALLVVFNVQNMRARWHSAGRASVYLTASASPEQVSTIERALRETPSVSDVRRISSEQARQELSEATPDPVLSELPEEAFPASLEFAVAERSDLERLSTQLEALPAVEAVETYSQWTERLTRLLQGGMSAAALLCFVIFASVVSVVSATVRLSLQRRRREVEILKLVGATDDYVRRPFVLEGAAQGALGALCAGALLGALYLIVHNRFAVELAGALGLWPSFLPWWALLGMIFVGSALGALAAYFSLRKLLIL
jgi:cell division transport system permease protein